MSSDTASTEDVRSQNQQSMLASQRAKVEAKHPTEANRTGRFGGYFTLGYKDAVSQWWANISPAMAEHKVMSFIPNLRKPPTHAQTGTVPSAAKESVNSLDLDPSKAASPVRTSSNSDPYGPRAWKSNMVPLSGKNRAINEFSVEREGEQVEENLVMLHGYGAGLGFFYKNFEGLSRVKGWKVYALDMLGMGRSSRPAFRINARDARGKITEAENFFIDALEEWRVKRQIEKFTLLGHSMGGYMAVAYALKYPGHLNKLILASPVGIPEDPYAVQAEMPSGKAEESALANEFLQDQEETSTHDKGDSNNLLNAQPGKPNDQVEAPRRPIPRWVSYLWDANISPFSIVRWTGPFGPRFTSGWTSRRFSHLPADEAQALHEYAYSLFRQRGSGEYALAYILAPGAFARSPLIRRMQGLGRQNIPAINASHDAPAVNSTATTPTSHSTKETGYPVIMMYGENDWMDVKGGYAAEKKINGMRTTALKTATAQEKAQENASAKVLIVQKAGHHVYLDGVEEFNEMMRAEMEETSRRSKWEREKGFRT